MTAKSPDLSSGADVVIVGAGSAGCVLAEQLSRNPDRSVLVLERGPAGWPAAQDRDVRRLPVEAGARHAVAHDSTNGGGVVRGSGLGGSSVINGGYFLRWHRDDFTRWPSGWEIDRIDAAYDELDRPGGPMGVEPVGDNELGDAASAFEEYWAARMPVRDVGQRWPTIGVNRVLSNRSGNLRMTAAEAFVRPASARPNLRVLTGCDVDELVVTGGRLITGVRTGTAVTGAGEVILSAGTLGTAGILLRTGLETLDASAGLVVSEHRSLAVSYRRRGPVTPGPLLPSVVHTPDALEIRCYRDDFASYICGLAPTGPEIGIAAMRDGAARLTLRGRDVEVDFEPVDAATAEALRTTAGEVSEMLRSPGFASFVEPGSVSVADGFGISQHAWGSMGMGVRTDWLGGVYGTKGLRIVDGSILPTGGRSGPHATIMMVASRIGARLADG